MNCRSRTLLLATATAAAAFGGIALGGSNAKASGVAPEPIRLLVRGAACGDSFSAAFFDDGRVRRAREGEAAREFAVSFTQDSSGGVRGELVVRDGAVEARREVHGRGCDDTTRSLLLVGRLALGEGRAELDPSAGDASADAVQEADAGELASRPTSDAASPAPASVGGTGPEAPVATPRAATHARAGDGVVGGRAQALSAPSFVIAPGLSFEWRGDPWKVPLVLGAGISLGLPTETARFDGGARLVWYLSELRLCAGAIDAAVGLRLEPCARIDGGAISATGLRVGHAQSEIRPWMATSLSGRARWRMARNLSLGIEAGLTTPLVREEFVLQKASDRDRAVLYRPPAAAFFSGLSLHVAIF